MASEGNRRICFEAKSAVSRLNLPIDELHRPVGHVARTPFWLSDTLGSGTLVPVVICSIHQNMNPELDTSIGNVPISFSSSRLAAGLSVDDVARDFGVTAGEVLEWEIGNARAPEHVVRSLEVLRAFGTTAASIPHVGPGVSAGIPLSVSLRKTESSAAGRSSGAKDALIKSKRRVADHGEVFTPSWLVERMLDLVKGETERIDARFLEPACGSGNFLVPILQRKLAAVEIKYGKSDFERQHYALLALTCVYGIELLADNITECRANVLEVFASYLSLGPEDDLYRAASHVLSLNLIHGDAMTMRNGNGGPITVVEWAYIGKGKFNRRDFRLDVLTGMAAFREERTLFAHLGKHEIFQAAKSYPPMTVRTLAAQDSKDVT